MEYRKLIKFGNSSHIISLPNSWIRKNKLKKGALIYFEENGNGEIILAPKEINNKILDKEITIDITGKEINEVRRELSTAYINNYRIINVVGKDLNANSGNIKNSLRNFMAMEIMEQTSKNITAKDFLDMNSISIDEIIRKIDIIVRALMADSKKTPYENNYDNIYQRDEDVNRLSFLIFRITKFALNNLQTLKNFNITPVGLLGYWQLTNHLEKIADEVKRVSRFVTKAKLRGKRASEFVALYSKIESYYLETIKVYYNKNKESAIHSTMKKVMYINFCDDYLNKYGDSRWVPNLIERFKIMINEIHSILKIVYEVYE